MRLPRLKAPSSHSKAAYHCISRVVDRRFAFGDLEREQFIRFMREYEAFCGVRIVTFCILSNHFHILVQVPQRPEQLPSDDELLRRLEALSGHSSAATLRQRLEAFRQQGHTQPAEQIRNRLVSRMWDVSAFMKLLKQRFSQWFNHRQGRKGTLWEQRFKSVLVEGSGRALAAMAAYIDLNPVRAGLVQDPKDYRWCGYAEAVAGCDLSSQALREVIAGCRRVDWHQVPLEEALADYRVWLFGAGEQKTVTSPGTPPASQGIDRESVKRVVLEKGRVPMAEYLRLKVRYFADGAVLGTRSFVEEIFTSSRGRFGARRRTGARRMKGLGEKDLFTVRDLRRNPVG